ncbi:MAG: CoA transferase [SAR202 cluster bacterium]|nr:CoA transferase [SAR202 cluster bacterium]
MATSSTGRAPRRGVLDGIRVLDNTVAWAGPLCSKTLGELGAEVIRMEACQRMDSTRLLFFPEREPTEQFFNSGAYYHKMNRNKLGITVNMSLQVFKELIRIVDVFVENHTPRVMPNFGLPYEELCKIRPDLIMISLTGYGQTGPYANFKSVGTLQDANGGLGYQTGYRDGPPRRIGISGGDPVYGLYGAAAVIMALVHRRRTGQGQHIDLSEREAYMSFTGELFLDYTLNDRSRTRMGNRHLWMAPHGCFPCKGNDKWVSIACRDDRDWAALVSAMGRPRWAQDERFSDALYRYEHQDELDEGIARWTRRFTHYGCMERLQRFGVPAGPTLNGKELLLDPHLAARQFFTWDWSRYTGVRPFPGATYRLSRTPPRTTRPAPGLGEHNSEVLGGLLGLSEERLRTLEARQVIGDRPAIEMEPRQYCPPTPEKMLELDMISEYDPDYRRVLGLDERDRAQARQGHLRTRG